MKALLKTLSWVLIVIMLCFVFFIAGVRIFGVDPYVVLSGSMGEAMPAGSMAYTVREKNFRVGDIVTWSPSIDAQGQEVRITHRIVAMDNKSETVTTKGDANSTPDAAPVAIKDLDGKVIFSIPMLGGFAAWLHTTSGIFAIIAYMIGLLFIIFVPNFMKKKKKQTKDPYYQSKHAAAEDQANATAPANADQVNAPAAATTPDTNTSANQTSQTATTPNATSMPEPANTFASTLETASESKEFAPAHGKRGKASDNS